METFKILSKKEVAALLNVHENTVNRLSKRPGFPAKIRIGERKVGFRSDQLDAYLAARTIPQHGTNLTGGTK